MKWLLNLFSGHSYTKSDNEIVREDGKVFTRLGDLWIDDEATIVQYTGDEFVNHRTGTRSTWGDAFADQ